jgi:hypothetical protein
MASQDCTLTIYRIKKVPLSRPLGAGKKISEDIPRKDQDLVISFGEISRNQVPNLLFKQR